MKAQRKRWRVNQPWWIIEFEHGTLLLLMCNRLLYDYATTCELFPDLVVNCFSCAWDIVEGCSCLHPVEYWPELYTHLLAFILILPVHVHVQVLGATIISHRQLMWWMRVCVLGEMCLCRWKFLKYSYIHIPDIQTYARLSNRKSLEGFMLWNVVVAILRFLLFLFVLM